MWKPETHQNLDETIDYLKSLESSVKDFNDRIQESIEYIKSVSNFYDIFEGILSEDVSRIV